MGSVDVLVEHPERRSRISQISGTGQTLPTLLTVATLEEDHPRRT